MKRIVFLLTAWLITFSTATFAKHIDQQTAKQVGQMFLTGTSSSPALKGMDNLELVYKSEATASGKPMKSGGQVTYFYVFNAGTGGFVIVAGDDNVSPILGYSDQGGFDPDNMPANLRQWLGEYENQIRYAIEQDIPASEQIQREWDGYYNSTSHGKEKSGGVGALLKTQWDQSSYYNSLCPGNGSTKTVTGCVATAMAQVMKYWNYPPIGTSFHSYNCSPFGTLSANFGATTYQWDTMPNRLVSSSSQTSKTAVATLMYHCGVSVNMQYDYAANGGSGAYTNGGAPSAEHALKTYFGYKSTLSGKSKSSYTNANWIKLLKTELDSGRPILYAGTGTAGGHAFVCDGYDDNDYFHFNWGWSGSNDGYYALTLLKPGSGGAGGGSYEFTSNQRAIIGIEPTQKMAGDTSYSDLKLSSVLNMSTTSVWFGSQISISANVINNAESSFNGTFGAAVFNSEGILINFIETKIATLQPNESGSYTFTHKGGAPFIPGNYTIAVFYKTADKDWTIVGNGAGYNQVNLKEFKIEYAASIETYSDFTIQNNGGRLIQNKSATVNVNMLNATSKIFYGKFRVSLANLDGTSAQVIQVIDLDEYKTNLPSHTYYKGGLDFTGNITVEPGTYLMQLGFQQRDSIQWYYAGSSNYQNPTFVIVEIGPDPYEVNDTISKAYKLPVNFSGNKASVKTTGSNFHIGSDLDFYKIELPKGYSYTIKPTLYSAHHQGTGKYTANGLFSYSTDGGDTWSEAYEDVIPNDIILSDGGTIHFLIAPSLAGETGTYLLDIPIERTDNTGVVGLQGDEVTKLRVYPNPAGNQLQITNYELRENTYIEIYSVVGQKLMQLPCRDVINHVSTIDISHLASGMYYLKINNQVTKFVKE